MMPRSGSTAAPAQLPPPMMPGTIEAEDYDLGGEGIAYHDVDANNIGLAYRPSEGVDIEGASTHGFDVYWITAGEWLEYTFEVPADGTVPYSYVTVPTNLKQDVWISAYEFVPGDRRVLHHVIAQVMEDDGKPATGEALLTRDGDRTRAEGATVGGYVPNRLGTVYPVGVASRLPAGADIEAQMHYTTIGEPATDRSSWGVVLAAEPDSMRRAGGGQVINPMFRIEPGNPSFEVTASRKIREDTYLSSMMPHMHVRGKSAKFIIKFPDGREEVALSVPNYDFNWQLNYQLEEPIFMPAGSELQTVFTYDNSTNNRHNPDPTAEVRWGDQTWEEMMLGYYGTVDGLEANDN